MGQAASSRRRFTTPLGRSLDFTRLGFGGAPLGNYPRALSEAEAEATLAAAWDGGLRYFDTAPLYGHGLSEARFGRLLKPKPRDQFLISTKVGRLLEPCAPGEEDAGLFLNPLPFRVRYDYRRDAVLRSFEESLARLGLDRVDILFVHDVEPGAHGSVAAYDARWSELTDGGGWRALRDLRDAGVVAAIGMGVNEVAPCERMLAELDPDLFLLAGRYTLLEQGPLHTLLPACERRGVGLVIGGPFNSGVLVRAGGDYNYAAAPSDVVARVQALRTVCEQFGAPLPTVALQFAAAHPVVASVIPGGQAPGEVSANIAMMGVELPSQLWSALKDEGLIDPAAPTPGAEAVAAC